MRCPRGGFNLEPGSSNEVFTGRQAGRLIASCLVRAEREGGHKFCPGRWLRGVARPANAQVRPLPGHAPVPQGGRGVLAPKLEASLALPPPGTDPALDFGSDDDEIDSQATDPDADDEEWGVALSRPQTADLRPALPLDSRDFEWYASRMYDRAEELGPVFACGRQNTEVIGIKPHQTRQDDGIVGCVTGQL